MKKIFLYVGIMLFLSCAYNLNPEKQLTGTWCTEGGFYCFQENRVCKIGYETEYTYGDQIVVAVGKWETETKLSKNKFTVIINDVRLTAEGEIMMKRFIKRKLVKDASEFLDLKPQKIIVEVSQKPNGLYIVSDAVGAATQFYYKCNIVDGKEK